MISYQLVSPDMYVLHRLGDEGVLFVKSTGDTHRLSELGLILIDLLNEKEYTVDQLMDQLHGSAVDTDHLNAYLNAFKSNGILLEC